MPAPPYPHHVLPGPDGLVAYAARPGGGPVFRVDQHGTPRCGDTLAFESTFRGGIWGAWGPDGLLRVAPDVGGGPVIKTFTPDGVERHELLMVVGELANDRRGIRPVPIPVPVERVVPGPTVYVDRPVPGPTVYVDRPAAPPVVELGRVTDPSHFLVYLQFEPTPTFPLSSQEMADVAAAYWELVEVLGNVAVTTVRPNTYPAGYGRVLLGPRLDFTRDTYPPVGVAGISPVSWTYRPDRWDDKPCWLDPTKIGRDAASRAKMMRHESWHGFGLTEAELTLGEGDPRNVAKARAGAAAAAAASARWR